MKIKINKADLGLCLNTIKCALGRGAVSVLDNIYFKSGNNHLLFSANNLEMEIQSTVAYGCEDGEMLLPPKIVDMVNSMPDGDITLDIDMGTQKIRLTGGQADFTLYAAGTAGYPPPTKPEEEQQTLTLEQGALKRALQQVVFAASTDIGRPAFNGVLFLFDGNRLDLVASDTHRIAMKTIEASQKVGKEKLLVPVKALRELVRVLGVTGDVLLTFPTGQMMFQFGNTVFAARLLQEKYPDIGTIFPADWKTKLRVKRKLLEDAVDRARLLAVGKNQAISLAVGESGLIVRCSSDLGQMEEQLSADKQGEDVSLYLNSRYVLDGLKAIGSDDVSVELNGPTGPVVMRPLNDDNYVYLLLPIRMEG